MKWIISFIVLFFCIQLAAQTDQKILDGAMGLFKEKKYEEAYWKIRVSRGKAEKKNAPSYATMAWFINEARKDNWFPPYSDKDNWIGEMLNNAELAIKYDRNNVMGHLMRGVYFYQKNDTAKASAEFDIADGLEPGHYYLALCRGDIYFAAGQYELAIEKYKKAIAASPAYLTSYWNMVQAYLGQKKYDEAIMTCKEYISLDKSMANNLVWLYNRIAAGSASNRSYLDSAYACINGIITPYEGSKVEEYYNRYKGLAQTYFNFCGKPTLDLINACLAGKVDSAIIALNNGADPNGFYNDFKYKRFKIYPLLYAARTHSFVLMKALLEAGANPDLADDIGRSALHYLGNNTDKPEEIVPLANLLFSHKANLEVRDLNGETPLVTALVYGYYDYLKWLIVHKANVNVKNNTGYTPIIGMARRTNNILKLFIDNGANINDTAANGACVFNDELYNGDYGAIYLLEKSGVRHTEKYNDPRYAQSREFIEYLRNNIIGRPDAKLFDALYESDLKSFKARLSGEKDKKLLNYLCLATMGFTYAKPFYDALVAAGADPEAKKYSLYFEEYIGPKDVFYPKKKKLPRYADFDLYYGQRADELLADLEYYGNQLTSKTFVKYESCDYIIQYAKVIVKIIDLCKEAQTDRLLSAESKARATELEQEQRAALGRWASRYRDEYECGGIFPKAD